MIRRLIFVLLFVVLVVGGVFFVNMLFFLRTPSLATSQAVVIEKGTPVGSIVRQLVEKGVITHGPFFKVLILLKGVGGKIRAGEYLFPAGTTPLEVLDLLLKGDFLRHRITIPEGWSTREIAEHLNKLGLVDAQRFLEKCSDPAFIQTLGLSVPHLEGYLFPDTYEIYEPQNEEEVIQRFVGRFRERVTPDLSNRMAEVHLSLQETVILASIVEKETADSSERPLIASVLLNRLRQGMPLAADPTLIYGIAHFSGNLTREDLGRPGPYNTYLNTGLPPTPIASPGIDSIRAVLFPAATDYLYFVSRNDGTHQFSRTEGEHQAAVRKFQFQRRRQRAETRPTVPTSPPESIYKTLKPETFPATP